MDITCYAYFLKFHLTNGTNGEELRRLQSQNR